MKLRGSEFSGQPQILILDPDEQTVSICVEAFTNRGWVVHHARSLSDALTLLGEHYYDLAIIELMLPDSDGTEAWRLIRLLSPRIVGIMTTSSPSLRNSINALERGILAYLQKPLVMPALFSVIDQFLMQKRGIGADGFLRGQFEGLNNLLQAISQPLETDQVPIEVLTHLQTILRFDWVMLYLLSEGHTPAKNHVQRHALSRCAGPSRLQVEFVQKLMVDALEGQELAVIRPTRISNLNDPSFSSQDLGLREVILVPIIGTECPYGVFGLINRIGSEAMSAPFDSELLTVVSRALAVVFDRTRFAKQAEADAIFDGKTGMGSSAYLESLITLELARWKRYGRPFSLILLQLPFESSISEQANQSNLLAFLDIAHLARSLVRRSDVVARFGDRQFVILLPESGEIGAKRVVARVNAAIQAQRGTSNVDVIPQIEIRISTPSQDSRAPSDLLASAERETLN